MAGVGLWYFLKPLLPQFLQQLMKIHMETALIPPVNTHTGAASPGSHISW